MSQPRIALFIPTYQSAQTVSAVIEAIPKNLLQEFAKIYVFDNRSKDLTVQKVQDCARKLHLDHLEVFINDENYLLGGSTIQAIRQSLADGFDYLICMHSDGQANPKDLEHFVKYCREDRYDFILGSRLMRESKISEYSLPRLLANKLFAKLQQLILKQKVYDLGAYVGFNLNTLKNLPFANIQPDMAYHPNLILNLSRIQKSPFRFKEFPIEWGAVTSSHVNVYTYAATHFFRLLKLLIKKPKLETDFSKTMKSRRIDEI